MGSKSEPKKSYDTELDRGGGAIVGKRDNRGRFRIIESEIDFAGKRVLDLGCNDGFFTFSAAARAKSVTGVDADLGNIQKNRGIAKTKGIANVEFICARISPEFLASLPAYDVVLFLSVFHHMAVNSATYDWNAYQDDELSQVLDSIRRIADVYVFEIGRPDEAFHWSRAVKEAIGEPRDWVPEHVFGPSYRSVKILEGVGYEKWRHKWLPKLDKVGFVPSRVSRKLHQAIYIDRRDLREIYVGRK